MARIVPTLPPRSAFGAGGYAEVVLLHTLELGLPGAYTLFHSVDWSRGVGEHEQHGEIDIVVVNQAGDVLLIELKSGPVDFAPGGIFKSYGSPLFRLWSSNWRYCPPTNQPAKVTAGHLNV